MKYNGYKGLKEAAHWRKLAVALHKVALRKKEEAEARGEKSNFDCDKMCKEHIEPVMEEAGLVEWVDWKKEKGKIPIRDKKGRLLYDVQGKQIYGNHYRLKVMIKMCRRTVELLVDPATGNKECGFINNKDLIGRG